MKSENRHGWCFPADTTVRQKKVCCSCDQPEQPVICWHLFWTKDPKTLELSAVCVISSQSVSWTLRMLWPSWTPPASAIRWLLLQLLPPLHCIMHPCWEAARFLPTVCRWGRWGVPAHFIFCVCNLTMTHTMEQDVSSALMSRPVCGRPKKKGDLSSSACRTGVRPSRRSHTHILLSVWAQSTWSSRAPRLRPSGATGPTLFLRSCKVRRAHTVSISALRGKGWEGFGSSPSLIMFTPSLVWHRAGLSWRTSVAADLTFRDSSDWNRGSR